MVDAERFLKESFEFIKNNSLEGCPAALAWLPEKSEIWKTYGSRMECPWKLCWGRRKAWSPAEAVLRHSSIVNSASFSADGMYIVTASDDRTARIWNTATGECEAELEGHSNSVTSAVFSPDGMHVVTASDDHTTWIWNTATGECEAELNADDHTFLSSLLPGVFILTDSHGAIDLSLQPSFLDIHEDTIFHVVNHQKLWITSPFRQPSCIGHYLSKICLGYHSGQILLLEVCIILYCISLY